MRDFLPPQLSFGLGGFLFGDIDENPAELIAGAGVVGAYVLCVLIMFWYFYAILAGKVIPYQDWLSHMWYRIGSGWI